MDTPALSGVARELEAARMHCRSMVDDLSQEELLWLPPRPDGISTCYHLGHIVFVEDTHIAQATQRSLLAPSAFQEAFGVNNVDNRDARFPPREQVLECMAAVRARTFAYLAARFATVRNAHGALAAAEVFRGIINHEYSHTKYMRRVRAEMGKPPVDPPSSALVRADENAIAPPQYSLSHW
jgi:hypothetical protein